MPTMNKPLACRLEVSDLDISPKCSELVNRFGLQVVARILSICAVAPMFIAKSHPAKCVAFAHAVSEAFKDDHVVAHEYPRRRLIMGSRSF
jgi:hypothetical protein